MGLIDRIREESQRAGKNKDKFFYIRGGQKSRVRFLVDVDDGIEIPFHDSRNDSEEKINIPCQNLFGRPCKYCGNDDLRHRSLYAWPIYNYDTSSIQILMQACNQWTAVKGLCDLQTVNGDVRKYDIIIIRSGTGLDTSYTLVPQAPKPFVNPKIKPLSKQAILKCLDEAYPVVDMLTGKMNEPKEDDWGYEAEMHLDYDAMTPRQLYDLCVERGLKAPTRKPSEFYKKMLKKWDEENLSDGWGEEAADEWEEDAELPFS